MKPSYEKIAAKAKVDLSKLPSLLDMSADTITENVLAINNMNCKDERTKVVFTSLVKHLHAFVRETELTTEEWMTAINFLTDTGKTCTDVRQEFILLSDSLGVSTLVDAINNAKPPGATEGTVLGPFFTEDAHEFQNGESIASEGKGEYMYVEGKILDTAGKPIAGAIIDTWETDGDGLYDNQYEDRTEPECRGRLYSAEDGSFSFRAVVPKSYPIPNDGPVGRMIEQLGRHFNRPAHLHMMIEAPGFEKLITALYFEGDEYLTSDAVFGVKRSLIVGLINDEQKPQIITDPEQTKARGFKEGKPHALVKKDFILATPEEASIARKKIAASKVRL